MKEDCQWDMRNCLQMTGITICINICWGCLSCNAFWVHLTSGDFYCFTNHDDVIKWKHFPRYWSFVRGIHRSVVNCPHKGQWHGAFMFSLICIWIKDWVNNCEWGWWIEKPLWSLWRHCNESAIRAVQGDCENIFQCPVKTTSVQSQCYLQLHLGVDTLCKLFSSAQLHRQISLLYWRWLNSVCSGYAYIQQWTE